MTSSASGRAANSASVIRYPVFADHSKSSNPTDGSRRNAGAAGVVAPAGAGGAAVGGAVMRSVYRPAHAAVIARSPAAIASRRLWGMCSNISSSSGLNTSPTSTSTMPRLYCG